MPYLKIKSDMDQLEITYIKATKKTDKKGYEEMVICDGEESNKVRVRDEVIRS